MKNVLVNEFVCQGFDFFFKNKPSKKEISLCSMVVEKTTPVKAGSIKVEKRNDTCTCVTIMTIRPFKVGYEGDLQDLLGLMVKWNAAISKEVPNFNGWELYIQKV